MQLNETEVSRLEDLPNVGPAIARDLRRIGCPTPAKLRGADAYKLYDKLCRVTAQRHDPCVLDTFISVVRFMDGKGAKPWWKYTAERKATLAAQPNLCKSATAGRRG